MQHSVFVNRILNMKKIKWIGLDMDHTLIRYQTKNFEKTVFDFVIARLISEKKYPQTIQALQFDFDLAIRGLVIDTQNGNILKLSRFSAIRQSYHGTKLIHFADQQQIYRSTYVDLNDPNYMVIDTAFSIAFCVLYSQLVDVKDKNPVTLPSYYEIAHDVLHMVDKIHADGSLKSFISKHLDKYVEKDPDVVAGLQQYIQHGKKFFVLTNSDYWYTKLLIEYAIQPFLPAGMHWQELFELVIMLANKPRFFYDNLKFLTINPQDGTMTNLIGPVVPGIYQGGNAKQMTEDLGILGDEILYIGDHIYGDVVRLKKACNWRTALVVEELGFEVDGQKKAVRIEQKITESMCEKMALEEEYALLCSRKFEQSREDNGHKTHQLQTKITDLDKNLSELLALQHRWFNPNWDRVFRAGAEESFFAYQVERYACIYMKKLADLLLCSPYSYFRAPRRLLPHDILS